MDVVTNDQEDRNNLDTHPAKITVNDVDVDFLPLIYDIIRSVDREPHDTQKAGQSGDISQKVLELHKKFELAREQVQRLPGVEYSKEEQIEKLDTLRKQLKLKKELLLKYRNMYSFDVPKVTKLGEQMVDKLAESPPMKRFARLLVQLFQESKTILPPAEKLKETLKSEKFQESVKKTLNSPKFQESLKNIAQELEKRTKRK